MSLNLPSIRHALEQYGAIVRVVVADIKGSTPREIGADMLVWADGQMGTIGGGELEWQACKQARHLLLDGKERRLDRVALGPSIGQCCGGSVTLISEVFTQDMVDTIENTGFFARPTGLTKNVPLSVNSLLTHARNQGLVPSTGLIDGWMIERPQPVPHPLWVYGAGHVGRAIVDVITRLPDFVITWIDVDLGRFPRDTPEGVNVLPSKDPQRALFLAPPNAHHLVLTYSHALDLELCHAALNHRFASFGMIGSATKWARFRNRLLELGHSEHDIDKIACPIGDRTLGKHPEAIALGVATELLKTVQKIRNDTKNNNREASDDKERKRG